MTDLLVKLYDLPPLPAAHPSRSESADKSDSGIRRARAPEREAVLEFVKTTFGSGWRGECALAFGSHPITCFIATEGDQVTGFACYDATFRGFFGPIGIAESSRGKGIGTALTHTCLHAMHEAGYAYAVIGATKKIDYFRKIARATEIPDSWPGAYIDLIK